VFARIGAGADIGESCRHGGNISKGWTCTREDENADGGRVWWTKPKADLVGGNDNTKRRR
jgi:hypothetical protein